jgi:hypothetical protein
MYVIFRFFVVMFAFGFACLAAAAVMVFGAATPALPSPGDWPILTVFALTVSVFIATFAFVPAVVVILVTEAFGLRSILIYAIGGALVGLFCGYTLGFLEPMPQFRLDKPLNTNIELLAAAGIAAGFVYWLIAGRTAGAWRYPAETSSAPR